MVKRLLAYIQAINEARKGRRKLLAPPASTPGTDSTNTHENSATDSQETVAGAVEGITSMATAVTTRSYDNQRTGANLNETVLTPAAILARGLTSYYSFDYEGDARGTEAPTLILPGVKCDDGLTHDLAFCVTMCNDVYGFDANTGGLLWERRIANPIKGTRAMDMYLIGDWWGILSTPVIDPDTKIGYCVAMTSPDATFANSSHWLHSINLVDGSEAHPPVDLSLAQYQPPNGLPLLKMGSVARKQRCALTLDVRNGVKTVFVALGSFLESAISNRGFVTAVDVTTVPKLGPSIVSTARYSGGGIWQGSQGGMVDPTTGDLFFCIGNGAFDGITDWSESCIRLRYTPSTQRAPGSFKVVDHYTAYTDTGRVAGAKYQTLADMSLLPSDYQDGDGDDGTSNMNGASDSDLNSGGPLMITKEASGLPWNIIVIAGKDGIGYFINADNMGAPQLADFAPDRIQANVYDKLLTPPIWLTYYNPTANPAPVDLATIPTTWDNRTHHLHGTCIFYRSIHGPTIYCMGENGNVRAFSLSAPNGKLKVTYLGCSEEYASPNAPVPFGGMPGGILSLSANGNKPGTALLHVCYPLGDANKTISDGVYAVYDAENFGKFSDGSGWIKKLWSTLDWGIRLKHSKFTGPHVYGGKVFVPSYDGRTLVFQLT